MAHTPSHYYEDPRLRDQIGQGWQDDMASPGPSLDERTLEVINLALHGGKLPSFGFKGGKGTTQDASAALMEEYPGLTAQEAGEYVTAYGARENPKTIFQTMGKFETLPKYKVTRQGLGGTLGGSTEYETDMILTPGGEFKHVPLAERTGGGYMRIGPPKKKVIRGAGGGIAQKKTTFDYSQNMGISRRGLYV